MPAEVLAEGKGVMKWSGEKSLQILRGTSSAAIE
jgi:hypothetical protein